MLPRSIIFFSLITLLLFSKLSPSLSKTQNDKVEDDDDLSFVDDENDKNGAASHDVRYPGFHQFEGYEIDGDEFDDYSDFDDSEKEPEIDDTDVVVLKERNFSGFIDKLKFVMVEFYSPWCAHCQALAPEYAEAAAELKEEGVVLAKVDATEETELALEYDIQGYPTIYFFVDGVHKLYTGERSNDAIVTWIKRKIGPAIHNITTLDDAERVLTSDSKLVLGYVNSLVGPESEELAAASRLEDDVNFYQTVNPDVAKLFHFDPKVKRPALILIKKEAEKLSYFDGNFSKLEIIEFVLANKLPLVTTFTRESAASVFENPIKKQLLLFATSNDSEKIIPIFQEAAKLFKGKLIFVYVALDNEEVGKPVADYFGASGNEPTVVAYTGNDDSRKFVLSEEVSLNKIKTFAEEFLEDQLKPFFKSDPIPETNYGDVKIVVGNNFDELVLDESKDVLLEIYAPWCGHCQTLEPTYNKLAKHLRGIKSLVIAKMDGTRNEHPRAKADGYPTILFFPAGNKSFEPLTVDTDRTVVALYKFIKEHASIPFKLRKPASTPKSKSSSDAEGSQKSSIKNVKDEL